MKWAFFRVCKHLGHKAEGEIAPGFHPEKEATALDLDNAQG
jgi:hypothetical protein